MNNLTNLPPITNPAWEAFEHGFISEASALTLCAPALRRCDPWGRPLPSFETMEAQRDGDGDVMDWCCRVQMGRQSVSLRILND